jgi:hypothetical protein
VTAISQSCPSFLCFLSVSICVHPCPVSVDPRAQLNSDPYAQMLVPGRQHFILIQYSIVIIAPLSKLVIPRFIEGFCSLIPVPVLFGLGGLLCVLRVFAV